MSTPRPLTFIQRILMNMRGRPNKPPPSVHVGTDYLGNEYFEQYGVGVHERRLEGKEMPKRWFFPKDEDSWDTDIPPEWEAWLRYRRLEQPTAEEIYLNMAVAHAKKINAKKLEEQEKLQAGQTQLPAMTSTDLVKESPNEHLINLKTGERLDVTPFPRYADLEPMPDGRTKEQQGKEWYSKFAPDPEIQYLEEQWKKWHEENTPKIEEPSKEKQKE